MQLEQFHRIYFSCRKFNVFSYETKNIIGKIVNFDGGTALRLPNRLPNQEISIKYRKKDTNQNYTISLKFIRKQNYSDQECIPLYNLLFRKVCTRSAKAKRIK